jgi:hypothetical protein
MNIWTRVRPNPGFLGCTRVRCMPNRNLSTGERCYFRPLLSPILRNLPPAFSSSHRPCWKALHKTDIISSTQSSVFVDSKWLLFDNSTKNSIQYNIKWKNKSSRNSNDYFKNIYFISTGIFSTIILFIIIIFIYSIVVIAVNYREQKKIFVKSSNSNTW